jgi:hypothetical protein
MLRIALDKVCEIVVKARTLAAKVDPEYGSNEGYSSDATFAEVSQFMDTLNEDEQIDLVALAWVGRDDFSMAEWDDAVAEARRAHDEYESTSTAEYLLGMPLLAEYLEAGLSKNNLSCDS